MLSLTVLRGPASLSYPVPDRLLDFFQSSVLTLCWLQRLSMAVTCILDNARSLASMEIGSSSVPGSLSPAGAFSLCPVSVGLFSGLCDSLPVLCHVCRPCVTSPCEEVLAVRLC